MDKVRGVFSLEIMTPLPEAVSGAWVGIVLARKDENHIAALVAEGHPVRKRVLPCHPAHIHT